MNMPLVLKILCLCVAMAAAETLHGIARNIFVVPRIGNRRAKQYSIISGTLLAFAVCYLMVPWLENSGARRLLVVGAILSLFMASFDIVLARFVAKQGWRQVLGDFNPAKGNFLTLGLILVVFIPYAVAQLKGGG